MVFVLQITYYATDLLGLNAAVIGGIILVSKIIDAFTDLGFGFILDKTHTRWGKAHPYEIFIILEWLFTILLFNVPKVGPTGQYIWIGVMYVIINAAWSQVLPDMTAWQRCRRHLQTVPSFSFTFFSR